MAIGTMYVISNSKDNVNTVSKDDASLFDNVGRVFDWLSDPEDPASVMGQLYDKLEESDFEVGFEDYIPYFVVSQAAKEAWFDQNFRRLKDLVSEMTLTEFTSFSDLCKIKNLINDEKLCVVSVCDGDYAIDPLDTFLRTAEEGKYYIGASFIMH